MARNRRAARRSATLFAAGRQLQSSVRAFSYGAAVFLLALAATIGALRLAQWMRTNEFCAMQRVSVRGVERGNLNQLLNLAGISHGDNLLALNMTKAAEAMAADPWVARVELRRRLPHVLQVEVFEHQPALLVELGGLYLANARGEVFKRLEPGDPLDMPVLTGLAREEYQENSEGVQRAIGRALELWRSYRALDFEKAYGLSEINVDQRGEITLVLVSSGIRVRLGRDDQILARLARLPRVLEGLRQRGLQARQIILDLGRRQDRAAVRLIGETAPNSREVQARAGKVESSWPGRMN